MEPFNNSPLRYAPFNSGATYFGWGLNSEVPMFPQPYHSGSTYPLGTALFQAVSITPIIPYHQPWGQQLQLSQQPFTQPHTPPQQGSSYHQIDGQAGATPRLTRYLTASQLHAIPTLSLCYALPMVVPQPCTATTHTPHTQSHERATERPQRATGTVGTTTGTARHREQHTANHERQARQGRGEHFKFCEGAGDQQPLTFFGFA